MLAVADASCSFESDLSSQTILQYEGSGHCAVVCSMLQDCYYIVCKHACCVLQHPVWSSIQVAQLADQFACERA